MGSKTYTKRLSSIILALICSLLFSTALGDETKWIAIGDLHNWYSSAGGEREVGRRGLIPDQQDGLRWPAQYNWQDTQAAKALWIGTTNYTDPLMGNMLYPYKVVHLGPRVLDETSEMMSQEFTMYGRYDHPMVLVNGLPGSEMDYGKDEVDEIDPTLPAERMIYNVVNTSIGITITRKIYAFTNPYHQNYHIYEYVFENTGIIDKQGTVVEKTLEGMVIFFQYRYAPTREASEYGGGWLPQSASWGHNTVNHTVFQHPETGELFRAQFAWLGDHGQANFNTVGGPAEAEGEGSDGHLAAAQYVGVVTLHADQDASQETDDPNQPFTTMYVGSDVPITSGNDQFNAGQMAAEYEAMTAGHPAKTMAEDVMGDDPPTPMGCIDRSHPVNTYKNTPGGFSHGQGFGPYTLAPGENVRIVLAEGVAGLSREKCYQVGYEWKFGSKPFELPEKVGGGTTDSEHEYKNAWVYTGEDSLFQTFERAIDNFNSGFAIPMPPPPPEVFEVNSGGDQIALSWSYSAGIPSEVKGFRVYRASHKPDTSYQEVFACGLGTPRPEIVTEFIDRSPVTGYDYYYYVVAFDDGLTNDIVPNEPLVSSKFWTMTVEPARLLRRSMEKMRLSLDDVRIVPNPFNIRANALQFGLSQRDRIFFYNVPGYCMIKIFTERGDLIKTIDHQDGSGDQLWDSVTSSNQIVVSGLYIAYIEVTQDLTDPITREVVYRKGDNVIKKFIVIR